MTKRLWLTIGLLVAVQLGALYVHSGYARAVVVPSRVDFASLPTEFFGWRGETVPSDAQITRSTGADFVVDRVYRRAGQPEVHLHCGIWNDPDSRAPHLPQSCYKESGWALLKSERVQLNKNEAAPTIGWLATWQRDSNEIRTLHWYLRGDASFFDWDGGCEAYRQLWGRTEWPAIEKVLLQTENDDPDRSRDRLLDLAGNLSTWIQTSN